MTTENDDRYGARFRVAVIGAIAALVPGVLIVGGVIFWVQAEARAQLLVHADRPHIGAVARDDFDRHLTESKERDRDAKSERRELRGMLHAIGRWQYGADEWKKAQK